MKFLKKLAMYLLGVALGLLIVWFLFGDRDIRCSYFPNDRVLNDLRKKDRQVAEEAASSLRAYSEQDSLFDRVLREGSINFSESEPRREPCGLYRIALEDISPALDFVVENCDSVVTLREVRPAN